MLKMPIRITYKIFSLKWNPKYIKCTRRGDIFECGVINWV